MPLVHVTFFYIYLSAVAIYFKNKKKNAYKYMKIYLMDFQSLRLWVCPQTELRKKHPHILFY